MATSRNLTLVGVLVAGGCGNAHDQTSLDIPPHTEVPNGNPPAAPPAPGLPEMANGPVREGPPPATEFSRVLDPARAPFVCNELSEDRSEANLLAVHRLGLELSSVRLEGWLGKPEARDSQYVVPLEVENVWLGPSFLGGEHTFIFLDEAERAGLKLPGRYLLGFGTRAGNSFPQRASATSRGGWDKQVLIPIAERDAFADLLTYSAGADPQVGVVIVSGKSEYGTTLSVVESLAGDLPFSVTVHWGDNDDANFPEESQTRYLATFASIHAREGGGLHFGGLLDFRPYTAELRAVVRAAISSPGPERNLAGLLAAARRYRTSWVFHRAPHVFATRVMGIANECCTGAGGTFFAHDVTADLREQPSPLSVMLGGHGYFSEEACGDRFLIALSSLDGASPPEPQQSFACDATPRPSIDSSERTADIRARLIDTPEARQSVNEWVRAPEPVYLLRPPTDGREPAPLGLDAVWSRPLSVEDALAIAPLARIKTLGEIGEPGSGILGVETIAFSPDAQQYVPTRFAIDGACTDPRLRQPGDTWLAPIVQDPTAWGEGDSFIAPGVLFPNYGYVERIASQFGYVIGAEPTDVEQ